MEATLNQGSKAATDDEDEIPLELYHPSHPHRFTVVVNRDGLLDRRWSRSTIAWCDIKAIERIRGAQRILVTLHNPGRYISGMPLFRGLFWRLKAILGIKTFCLDTAELDIRTKELNSVAQRFWLRYRGEPRRWKRKVSFR